MRDFYTCQNADRLSKYVISYFMKMLQDFNISVQANKAIFYHLIFFNDQFIMRVGKESFE